MENFSFFIDPAREKNLIITMFSGFDPAGLESRAEQTGIPLELARKVRDKSSGYEEEVHNFVDGMYLRVYHQVERAKEKLEEKFVEIGKSFKEKIEKLTEKPLKPYNIHVSQFFTTSNWYGRTITYKSTWKNDEKGIWSLFYEVLTSHIFQMIRELCPKGELDDRSVWAIAQITTSIFVNSDELHCFYPNEEKTCVTGYDGLLPFEKPLRDFYRERRDMTSYLTEAIEYMKEHPFHVIQM